MRTPSPFLPLLILAVMLATVHLSSCRQLTWASYQQTKFSFAHHFSSSYYASVSGNSNKYTAAHDVSHKECIGSAKERT
ncbi:hypothetical protein V6Z11_A09G207800 [Gossypium hirsutum]